jgi:hypothetical protein
MAKPAPTSMLRFVVLDLRSVDREAAKFVLLKTETNE